jgi:predicted nucleic acid-binding protein
MNGVKAFLDTNLFVYLYSGTDIARHNRVVWAINQYDCFVSTQVLNEFCHVCIRKLKLPLLAIEKSVAEILDACNLVFIDDITVMAALRQHEKYGYSYYDCLMIASALESGCQYLLSEDMAEGQVIGEAVTIKNIFTDIPLMP